VKITLELPGDLLRRTKSQAASDGRSMNDFVVEALEEKLRSRRRRSGGGWRAVFGRAKHAAVHDVERRLRDLELVRPEDRG
jgi:hypothetical protein